MVQCKRNHFFAAAWLRTRRRLQAVGDVTPLGTDRSQNALSVGRWQVINDATHAGDDVIDHAIWASSIGASSTVVDLHNGLIGGPVDGRPFAEAKAPQTTMSMTERPLRVAASSFGLGTVSRMVRFDRPVDRWRTLPR